MAQVPARGEQPLALHQTPRGSDCIPNAPDLTCWSSYRERGIKTDGNPKRKEKQMKNSYSKTGTGYSTALLGSRI